MLGGSGAPTTVVSGIKGEGGSRRSWLERLRTGRQKLLAVAGMGDVRQLLLARAMVDMSVMIMHAVFADFTYGKFGWEQSHVGFGMAFTGERRRIQTHAQNNGVEALVTASHHCHSRALCNWCQVPCPS